MILSAVITEADEGGYVAFNPETGTTSQGETFDEAYAYARALAAERHMTFVPPFDDARVIAGQGTCGLEILEQAGEIDAVIVPIGGGGLASGIALAIKEKYPHCFMLGVESEWAVTRRASGGNPKALPLLPDTSIADGIAVKQPGKLTAPLLERLLDKRVNLSEKVIAQSIIKFLESERVVVEVEALHLGIGRHGVDPDIHCPVPYAAPPADQNVFSQMLKSQRSVAESVQMDH